MEKVFFILLTTLCILFSSCGDENNEPEPINNEEQALINQEKMFQSYKTLIIGSWKPYETWKSDNSHESGWYPIANSSWGSNWIFNSDGTGYEVRTYYGKSVFRYQVIKNTSYKNPLYDAPIFVKLVYSTGIENKYGIEIEDNFLRLYESIVGQYEYPSAGGSAAVRYKRI